MSNFKEDIHSQFKELFDLAEEIHRAKDILLKEFNERKIKLFDLPPYKRISLFIITRSIKTYSSILVLCQEGYGQDVSTLLRTLLENLVTLKYILFDLKNADDMAKRFVAYKWIIFKRQLPEQEKKMIEASEEEKKEFYKKRDMILGHAEEFKKTFRVTSDRALITWSGKTVRDMAKLVDKNLLDEYDTTFRLCSRFSHPSILGDHEYLVQDERNIIFSPLPSGVGIVVNLKNALQYALDILFVVNDLFNFSQEDYLRSLDGQVVDIFKREKYSSFGSSDQPPNKNPHLKESIINFKIQ